MFRVLSYIIAGLKMGVNNIIPPHLCRQADVTFVARDEKNDYALTRILAASYPLPGTSGTVYMFITHPNSPFGSCT